MKAIFHKSRSLGVSTVKPIQPTLQLGHFLFQVHELPKHLTRKGYFAVLISEIALVNYFKSSVEDIQETNNIVVSYKRLADVVNLSSSILTFGVRQKRDARETENAGTDLKDLPVWTLPGGIELCFDEYAFFLPDSPAQQLQSTMSENLLWNSRETFVEWLTNQRHAMYALRKSFRDYDAAKLNEMMRSY